MKLRWHWGTGVAVFYTLFAVATTAFAVFAMEQRVELVSGDYYQRALQHDGRMAAIGNAAQLGDAFRVETSADARTVTFTWRDARPDAGTGRATMYRPSDAAMDRTIALAPDASGRQQLSLYDLPFGHWTLQVQWRHGGRDFYVERPLVIR